MDALLLRSYIAAMSCRLCRRIVVRKLPYEESMTRIALVFGVALSLWASAAMAQNYSIGSIEVGKPWSRATPKGQRSPAPT